MPVTFDIYPEFIEAKLHRVDTIERAYEEKLLEEKWSRNKTLPVSYTHLAREIKDGKFTGKVFSPIVLTGYVPDLLKSISMLNKIRSYGSTRWTDYDVI